MKNGQFLTVNICHNVNDVIMTRLFTGSHDTVTMYLTKTLFERIMVELVKLQMENTSYV